MLEIAQRAAVQVDQRVALHVVGEDQRVATFVGVFLDQVQFARLVKHIGVVAGAANHCVQTSHTVEYVTAGVTGQHVVLVVAHGIDAGISSELEILEVAAQGVADRCANGVDFVSHGAGFDDHITDVVDHIDIVAGAPVHVVFAGIAIEDVVQGIAVQDVVEGGAGGVFDLGAKGNRQATVERIDSAVGVVLEIQTQAAVGPFVQVEGDAIALGAGIDRVVAAGIPDGFEYRPVGLPRVDVVAGLPVHVGAVQRLDGENVQHHRCRRLGRIAVVVTHDRIADIVQRRVEQCGVRRAGGKRVLEAQGMTDLVDVGHVVIGTLDRVVGGRLANPDIPAARRGGGGISPGSGLIAHQAVTAEPQVTDIGNVVGGLGKADVSHGTPGGKCRSDAVLLIAGQRIDGLVFVVRAVVGREIGCPGLDKAVGQLGRTVEGPIDACPVGSRQQAVDCFIAGEFGIKAYGITSWARHADFLSALRPFLNATATKKCDFAPETVHLTSMSHHFSDR